MTDVKIAEKLGLSTNDKIASFDIFCLRYLDKDSKPTRTLPDFVNETSLQNLYEKMVTLRLFDTKTINLQRTGKLGTYASTLGQEAIFVGIGAAMKQIDVLAPYYRDYGAQLQRGVTMTDILRYWGGSELGSAFNHPEDFPISVPIASQTLHAAGIAKAIQYRKEKRAVVTTCGEGGTSKGDFYEAINLAGAWNLPLVFVVNNNQWAISVPRHAQTSCNTIAQKAISGGFEGIQVDGNDIIAVKEAVHLALEKARNGQGPTLIEAMTYRLCDHTTADDASRYRPSEELEQAWREEPIIRLRKFMEEKAWWDETKEAECQAKAMHKINEAVEAYLNTPAQSIDSIFDYMYAETYPELEEQKAYANRFGGSAE
jgi:2-oxoisovalerate dehydrogenase E1 component alpha subunit